MTATLAPIPFLRYTSTSTGLALVGGQVFTFAAGTSTPQATYTDATGNTPNTNPIILNSRGECSCYLNPSLSYKLVFKDSLGNTISTYDNIRAQNYDRNVYYVENFGAVGDGATDSTAAIQAAIDQAPTGSIIAFGVGDFKVSSLTISKSLTIRGSGKWNSTFLTCSSATLDMIVVTTTGAVGVCDINLRASVTRTAGAFVKVSPATSGNFDSYCRRVVFSAPWVGINFLDASDFTVDDCYFVSYLSSGILVANVATPDAGDSLVFNNTFDGSGGAVNNASINQFSSGGLRVVANKFLAGSYHYLGQMVGQTSILVFTGNSTENAGIANIALNATNPITFSKVVISGNQFSVGASATGIAVSDPGYSFLDDMSIGDNTFNLGAAAQGISLGRGIRVSIFPNSFIGNGGGTGCTGVVFTVNCTVTVWTQNMPNVTVRYTGTLTNVTFVPGGLVQTATNTDTTNAAYGTLFSAPTRAVTFAAAYPKPPTVTFQLAGNGAASCVFTVVPTTTGFTYQTVGAVNASAIAVTWTATGG